MKRLLEWTTLVGLLGSALLIWLFATGRIGAVAGSQIGDPLIVGLFARDHAVATFFRALWHISDWLIDELAELPKSPSVPVKGASKEQIMSEVTADSLNEAELATVTAAAATPIPAQPTDIFSILGRLQSEAPELVKLLTDAASAAAAIDKAVAGKTGLDLGMAIFGEIGPAYKVFSDAEQVWNDLKAKASTPTAQAA